MYGVPLTRTLDENLQKANRAVACPDGWATPPKECDEYPMAATRQGASKVAPGDWSRREVASEANSSQGGLMSYAFLTGRILENDPFLVLAVRPDGRTSW